MKDNKKKIRAYVELFLGAAAFLAGLVMFFQTRGTRLLHVTAGMGKFYGFFWLFLLLSLPLLLIGIWGIRHLPKKKDKTEKPAEEEKPKPKEQVPEKPKPKEQVPEKPKPKEQEPEEPKPKEQVPEEPKPDGQAAASTDKTEPIRICPACGKENKAGNDFCIYCGSKITS